METFLLVMLTTFVIGLMFAVVLLYNKLEYLEELVHNFYALVNDKDDEEEEC